MAHRYHEAQISDDAPVKRHTCQCSRMKIMALTLLVITLIAAATIPAVVLTAKQDKQQALRIGSFNIRHFGKSKMSNDKLAHDIDLILQRYDVVLIIEVTDKSQTSIKNLLQILRITNKNWNYVSSDRIGRSSYKEQYVFFYKSNLVTVKEEFQLPDPEDVFEREPFAIKIKYKSVSSRKTEHVALAAIHIKPSDALAELKALPVAIENISISFNNINGVIVMGDYNAACSYLGKKNQRSLPLFTSPKYRNLILHTMDTTVAQGDCAYDRITVYGSDIKTRDPYVYRFDEHLHMNLTETLDISDHYPVEFLLL